MSFFRDISRILREATEPDTLDIPSNIPSNIVISSLDSDEALGNMYEASLQKPVVVFKHSATCAISAFVRRRILQLDQEDDPAIYELVVQSSRPLSQKIEKELGIRHESPQVIVVHKQQPIFNASHSMITVDSIRTAIVKAPDRI